MTELHFQLHVTAEKYKALTKYCYVTFRVADPVATKTKGDRVTRFLPFRISSYILLLTFKKYKTYSVLIYSYINNTSGIGKTRNCVETRRPQGGKFCYNIAQNSTKLLQCMSGGKFSVFTSSYVNTALDQSAIRIHKCYIIIIVTNSYFDSRPEPKDYPAFQGEQRFLRQSNE